MTQIKMRSLMAGPDGTRLPGKVYSVSPEEAKSLIDGGYAEAVKESAKPQVSASAPRAATRSRGRTAAKPEADDANSAESGGEADADESGGEADADESGGEADADE